MADIHAELDQLRAENARLKAYIGNITTPTPENGANGASSSPDACPVAPSPWDGVGHGLSKDQVGRYSRQIILPSFGVEGEYIP